MTKTNNFKMQNHLPILDAQTERRLKEVKYQLIYLDVVGSLITQDRLEGFNFLDGIGKLFGIDAKLALSSFYYTMQSKTFKISKAEIILMCLYDGLSYEDIKNLYGFSPSTISKHKKKFIEAQLPYTPKMEKKEFEYFEQCMDVIDKVFIRIGERSYVHNKKSRLMANRQKVNAE